MPTILQDRHFKSFKRALLKNRVSQTMFAALLAGVIYFMFVTSRTQRQVHPEAAPYMHGERNAIFAFWHGRMMLMSFFCPPKRKMSILISQHRDGLLISRVIAFFGQRTVAGSSSKGGAAAVKEVLRTLKAGENVGITPDGPRGPFQTVSEGTIALARMSGLPIIPVSFSAAKRRHFKSWDRFCFALPFGKVIFTAERPVHVARDSTPEQLEALRQQLEAAMRQQAHKADLHWGVSA